MRIFFIIFLMILSCTLNKDFIKNKWNKYTIFIPSGYINNFSVYCEHGTIYYFEYEDSTLFYYGKDIGTNPNDTNINKNVNKSYNIDKIFNKEKLIEHKGKNKLFWLELFYNDFVLGYKNVSQEKKNSFDDAIEKFKKKNEDKINK